ncbi:MAG: peptidoglycan-binding domain-containing protein [Stellaceae bacterium]
MRTLMLATVSAVALAFAGAAPGFAAENTAATPGATITHPVGSLGAKTMAPATSDTGTTNSSVPRATTSQPANPALGSSAQNANSGLEQNRPATTSSSASAAAMTPATPSQIREAQQKLHSEGLYRGAIDGRMGPETQQALRHYQQKNGLQVTARLDQETMSSLRGTGTGQGSSMPNSPVPSSSAGTSGSSWGQSGGQSGSMNPASGHPGAMNPASGAK